MEKETKTQKSKEVSTDKDMNDLEKQKRSLEEMDVMDGKDRSKKAKDLEEARELEALFGVKELNPYGTMNQDIFERDLEEMTTADLMALASRVGVTPVRNARKLRKDLSKSFSLYAKKASFRMEGPEKPIIPKNSPDYKKTVRLFEE